MSPPSGYRQILWFVDLGGQPRIMSCTSARLLLASNAGPAKQPSRQETSVAAAAALQVALHNVQLLAMQRYMSCPNENETHFGLSLHTNRVSRQRGRLQITASLVECVKSLTLPPCSMVQSQAAAVLAAFSIGSLGAGVDEHRHLCPTFLSVPPACNRCL